MNSLIKTVNVEKKSGGKDKERCRECMYGLSEGGWWRELMQKCTWSHSPMHNREKG